MTEKYSLLPINPQQLTPVQTALQRLSEKHPDFEIQPVNTIRPPENEYTRTFHPYNHSSSKCKRQIKTISEVIVKHLWDKGQMWPLFATTTAYVMNTFVSEALSDFSPFKLVFLRDHQILLVSHFQRLTPFQSIIVNIITCY